MAKAVDVTEELRAQGHLVGVDFNNEDRVYRMEGRLLKVKTFHDQTASAPGLEILRVSVSEAGEDGKALRRPNGQPAILVDRFPVTIASQAEINLPTVLEQVRQQACEVADRAARNYEALQGVTGVAARHFDL